MIEGKVRLFFGHHLSLGPFIAVGWAFFGLRLFDVGRSHPSQFYLNPGLLWVDEVLIGLEVDFLKRRVGVGVFQIDCFS